MHFSRFHATLLPAPRWVQMSLSNQEKGGVGIPQKNFVVLSAFWKQENGPAMLLCALSCCTVLLFLFLLPTAHFFPFSQVDTPSWNRQLVGWVGWVGWVLGNMVLTCLSGSPLSATYMALCLSCWHACPYRIARARLLLTATGAHTWQLLYAHDARFLPYRSIRLLFIPPFSML